MQPVKIIPCLDINGGKVVKGKNFVGLSDIGDPLEIAKEYCSQGADELVFLDISATVEGRKTMLSVIERAAKAVSVPLTVGGGISSIEDIERVLCAGADKVSLNTGAVKNPGILREASEKFGKDSITLAIDAKKNGQGGFDVYINGGFVNTGIDAVKFARQAEELGVGAILVTSIDKDGAKSGYDIELLRAISGAVSVPVIASGGAGELEHFYDAVILGGVSAVLSASLFHYKQITVRSLKEYLRERGIAVL